MVMLDMAAMLCFSHERGVTEEGARRLLTLLLTGAEAAERREGGDQEIIQWEAKSWGQTKNSTCEEHDMSGHISKINTGKDISLRGTFTEWTKDQTMKKCM